MSETLVFSYRRFSSGRQAAGHSLQRQTESAHRWCLEHGYKLDESLALADLGVSAYSGDNVARGALSGFLNAVESGRVPKGSILLLESLDRLTRVAIPEAVGLLTSIVRSGVRVVSMLDGTEWNNETINDTASFMLSVVFFSRAHEESATKAKRVSAAFQRKRDAGLPVVSHGHGPGWATPRSDRQSWEVDASKASVVRRVFELAALGKGGIAISRQANQEGWQLPWRDRANTNPRWAHSGVSRLPRDRRVLGEWQPKRMVAGRLTSSGDAVKDYFPRVVSEELWQRVQSSLGGRVGPLRLRGIRADVFSGLLFCQCGERMDRKSPSGRGYARYYCLGRKNGATECSPLPESLLLGSVLPTMAQVHHKAFNPDNVAEEARQRLALAKSKFAHASDKADRLLAAVEDSGHSELLLRRLAAVEDERTRAEAEIGLAEVTLSAIPMLDRDFGAELAKAAVASVAAKADVEGRQRLAQALTQVVVRIVWYGTFCTSYMRTGEAFVVMAQKAFLSRAKNRNAGKPRVARPPMSPDVVDGG